ncbi:MAG: hypothetical protein ACTH4Y_08300 [Microbacterium gubbeenense]|uniref:hypothetical protein n=1 Tax=Microbacterium gubbeenense TaxID=159896 RepID=UPI003F992D75
MSGTPNYQPRADALALAISIHKVMTPSGYHDADMIVQDARTFEKFLTGSSEETKHVVTVNGGSMRDAVQRLKDSATSDARVYAEGGDA